MLYKMRSKQFYNQKNRGEVFYKKVYFNILSHHSCSLFIYVFCKYAAYSRVFGRTADIRS